MQNNNLPILEMGNKKRMEIKTLISNTFKIELDSVVDDLEYLSINEWDSLGHVNLMIALEQKYCIQIDPDLIVKLNSVAAIVDHIEKHNRTSGNELMEMSGQNGDESEDSIHKKPVHRGLSGVVFDRTRTTFIDGHKGKLQYKGYSIHDLVEFSTFEETTFLFLYGMLPTTEELSQFNERLKVARDIPTPMFDMIRTMSKAHPIEVLRTAVSLLSVFDPEKDDVSMEAFQRRAIRLISQVPILVAAHQAIRQGKEPISPDPSISHAANFLYMLNGKIPTESAVRVVDKVLILHTDHGSNASAFTARVVSGTGADIYASLTAAISAFAGPLHGGAIENVMSMIQEIGESRYAAEYVMRIQSQNRPVMGFGHRVYKTEDPRARHLRKVAFDLSSALGDSKCYDILEAVVDAMHPYMEKGVGINVDLYASVVYHLLGISSDLFISSFVVGRIPGWIAQIQEQCENNILIRPLLEYVGDTDLAYIPIDQRGKKS
ncbi:citrate synthase [Thermoactinomyces sp. DSM 45891]|uniref:citrate/2-methylcitrate synthase n=1 Tax=Thermoactinomyces sp. DSM 45891 TaxID=1761907 RepID=UPI000918D06D|nr:citrate/2-methylcitrate synthase [Thermoactinomyces sp. DSM 45891]SFX57340.1 citrate synthase [Thermoactinomyces sp. DSM 45891]